MPNVLSLERLSHTDFEQLVSEVEAHLGGVALGTSSVAI